MDALGFSRITVPDLIAQSRGRTAGPAQANDFASLLREGVQRLDSLQSDAADQARRLMAGEPIELHRVVLAAEEANLAFDLALNVRNKVVEAYQEIMRTQV